MDIALRPSRGGFLRPFGCAWFIVEFLEGNGPEGSLKIDPDTGVPMVDIHYQYKTALHRDYAEDAVALDEEEQKRKILPPFTIDEAQERLRRYISHIPYKLTKMRYSSFCRYLEHLKRLRWIEETGKTEPSGIQDSYPPAPSRVYYRMTEVGKKATLAELSNPLRLLYPEFDSAYFKEKRSGRHYYTKKRRQVVQRSQTAMRR